MQGTCVTDSVFSDAKVWEGYSRELFASFILRGPSDNGAPRFHRLPFMENRQVFPAQEFCSSAMPYRVHHTCRSRIVQMGSNPDSRTRAMLFLIPDCAARPMPDSRSPAMSFSFPDCAKWAMPDSRPGAIFFSIPDYARELFPKSESLRKQKEKPVTRTGLGIRDAENAQRFTGRWRCCLLLRVRVAVVRLRLVCLTFPPAVFRRPHRSADPPVT